jgi:hypothetical protein
MHFIKNNSKGSALMAVLTVLFVLLTVFFSVFGFAVSRSALLKKKINIERASYLADAGINHLLFVLSTDSLNWRNAIETGIADTIFTDEKYSVRVDLSGGYLMATSTGSAGNRKAIKKALIGLMPSDIINAAVINGNINYPLVLAGHSYIHGDVIVGPEAVTRGAIEGETSPDTQLVAGRIILQHSSPLPQMDPKIIEEIQAALFIKIKDPTKTLVGSSVISKLDIPKRQDHLILTVEDNLEINSLRLNSKNKEITIFASGDISIRGKCHLEGPLEIVASGSIDVSEDSFLDGPLLYAQDSIIFRDKAFFRGQAICGERMEIGGNCRIDYPSLLFVMAQGKRENDSSSIEFTPGTVSRTLAFISGNENMNLWSHHLLRIDTEAIVIGIAYSGQLTELRGSLYGVSLTDSYWFYKPPTSYINWLHNSVIDRSRSDFFPVFPLTFPNYNGFGVFREFEEDQ